MARQVRHSQLDHLFALLVPRCTFPPPGTAVDCAFSGGPDSSALLALAGHHGLRLTAHHVDHRLRPESTDEAARASEIASLLDVPFVLHTINVAPGPNLEARARHARRTALPEGAMTGHTADDQAETVVIRLLRGSGSDGLSGMDPGVRHPLLSLRRSDTEALCAALGIVPVRDASNNSPAMWRNRIRSELIPLADAIAGRDVTAILVRTADLLRDEHRLLDELAAELDPTDARAIAGAPLPLARRAIRRWLTSDGYPPDAAAVERVLAVAGGDATACELPGGRRIERTRQRLRIVDPGQ